MNNINFYRDSKLPFFEIKSCSAQTLSYRKHSHEEFSLAVIEKGTSTFWFEGRKVLVEPGSVVFIPSEVLHSCNPDPEQPWEYLMVFVDSDWLLSSLGIDKNAQQLPQSMKTPHIIHHRYNQQIYELIACLTGDASCPEKESAIIEVFVQFLEADSPAGESSAEMSRNDRQLDKVRDYLDENFTEDVSLDVLSQISGFSKYHMLRLFKEKFHVPPHTYQLVLRINYSKKELKKQRPVSEVAQDAGFYDQSHFIRHFRLFVGTTPEMYQRSGMIV